MAVNVSQLILEVGRKCNRNCTHCLRGASENKTICMEDVFAILNQVENIGCITFTGGEPTLYGEEISAIVDYIIDNKINVDNFYVASNGEIYNETLMLALVRLYAHCTEYGDNEISAYDVSNDQFHHPDAAVIRRLKAFSFFSMRKEIPAVGILNEGNAYYNCIGARSLNHTKPFEVEEYDMGDHTDYWIEMVYLNAEGYLLADCDFSYETQRSLPKYKTIAEIIEQPIVGQKVRMQEVL